MDKRLVAGICVLSTLAIGVSAGWAWAERVEEAGFQSSLTPLDVRLGIGSEELTIKFRGCATKMGRAQWFLHAVPADAAAAAALPGFGGSFINMDGAVLAEKQEKLWGDACLVRVALPPLQIDSIRIGQFEMPDGKCCKNIWQAEVDLSRIRQLK